MFKKLSVNRTRMVGVGLAVAAIVAGGYGTTTAEPSNPSPIAAAGLRQVAQAALSDVHKADHAVGIAPYFEPACRENVKKYFASRPAGWKPLPNEKIDSVVENGNTGVVTLKYPDGRVVHLNWVKNDGAWGLSCTSFAN